ncbi:hypothetical protein [Streptomyces indiaensis]|uniref:Uncharacterized protein n=1 Tax=Streptomyces indiaensis TaxID=284033 RepID=A0ABP5QAE9_9ACTN|nr:hypothetical protein [Streptomyces indiaensis]MCF1644571.1 hypothetical protein [Streptomyces indiaensis]
MLDVDAVPLGDGDQVLGELVWAAEVDIEVARRIGCGVLRGVQANVLSRGTGRATLRPWGWVSAGVDDSMAV